MSVLILSRRKLDPHSRVIEWVLQQRGIAVHYLDLTGLPAKSCFSLALSNNMYGIADDKVRTEGINLPLHEIGVVWARRIFFSHRSYDFSGIHKDDLDNVKEELKGLIPSAYSALELALGNRVVWVNPFTSQNAARSKAMQLMQARAAGFVIPDTLIGNEPAAIREFCERHQGSIVMKPFYPMTWQDKDKQRSLPTTIIQRSQLSSDKAIQYCPAIYQEYIAKAYELRVLILGDEMIAVKIDSQSQSHARIDWRLDNIKRSLNYSEVQLSAATKLKLRLLMRAMGLNFGSVDLIIDQTGREVFLEVNEQGQFLFLEANNPTIHVVASVARYLAGVAGYDVSGAWPSYADFKASAEFPKMLAELEAQC